MKKKLSLLVVLAIVFSVLLAIPASAERYVGDTIKDGTMPQTYHYRVVGNCPNPNCITNANGNEALIIFHSSTIVYPSNVGYYTESSWYHCPYCGWSSFG